jgi:Cd2+/Zn2+-exporting ATPase
MVEKNKVKVLDVLDDIGCGCDSCNDDNVKLEPVSFTVLDDVSCGCSSCDDEHEHQDDIFDLDHDHDHNHHHEIEAGLKGLIKSNYRLILSFIIFFTALFTKFNATVDIVLFLIAYFLVSTKVLSSAIRGVLKGKMLDENFLMSIASIVAFGIGESAEGVAVMLFYAVGQLTEEYAVNRSKKSISSLLDLRPDFANVLKNGQVVKVDPSKVKINDRIVVKPGERIPLDGIVIKGQTEIDSAMLTGESLPVSAGVDTDVYSGTINLSSVIEVRVTKLFSDSAVSKILKMVQKANENKAVTEKFITKFAKVYTPIVVLAAGLISIIPPLLFGASFQEWIYKGAIFLVVSCPCALVISVPLGYFGGIGGAARKGLLVKGGQFLEVLKKPGTIVLDKTGTLTKGNFSVDHIDVLDDLNESEILFYGSHLESFSNHPIAKAITMSYSKSIDQSIVHDMIEIPGKGIKGTVNNKSILIGNEALMSLENITIPMHDTLGTTLYLSVDNILKAIIHINDEIKEKTHEGLQQLRELGVKRFVMLTGDRQKIADDIASKLGIGEVHAELLPGDKLNILEGILDHDDNVIFVGDGINDAPVLSRADVGIAMGNLGSDVAIESSDVVLMNDEITTIADGVKVSKYTGMIILQNIVFALSIKILIMILGTFGIANLWMAIFGDVGVAFIAILNSGRAVYKK